MGITVRGLDVQSALSFPTTTKEGIVSMEPFERTFGLIRRAVASGQLAGAAAAIGDRERVYRIETFGHTSFPELTGDETAVDRHTLYDMASVTKIMATTMITLHYLAEGQMDLADTLPVYFGGAVPPEKQGITLFQLLTHTAGFAASIRLENHLRPGEDVAEFLLTEPLAYVPGSQVVYSCMGFILLAKALERIGGNTLDLLARDLVFKPLGMDHTGYHRLDQPIDPANTAYTERDHITGQWLVGRVHDENARFQNGVSGNAGVFSDIEDCVRFARMLAGHGTLEGTELIPQLIFRRAICNYTPGMEENRGLGFHLANGHFSYSGLFFDQTAFGHTGFTGPHMLVSPESGLYVVLLNNRVHPDRDRDSGNLRLRRLVHTQAALEYDHLQRK